MALLTFHVYWCAVHLQARLGGDELIFLIDFSHLFAF